ncbi:MAG: hypothetical protein IPI24_00765 [Ignavibacteria bacterium]|nr:hypothetical protein [Ignavibacteria bacterium]
MSRKVITSIVILLVSISMSAQNDLKWSIVADMGIGRYFFEAQPIDAHRVLIIGGMTRTGVTRSVQIYDARTKTVTEASSMFTPRYAFSSQRLNDGRIMVSGGAENGFTLDGTASIEIYDPNTDTWSDGGTMNQGRWQHSSVLLSNGRILILGGWGGPQMCEIYDPLTRRSSVTATFPYVSSFGKATRSKDGKVLAFSGRSGGPGSFRTEIVHRFDETVPRWVEEGSMSRKLYYPTMTKLDNGDVVLTGGSEQEDNFADVFATDVQHLRDNGFVKIGDLASPRAGHETVEYSDGRLIVMGGMDNNKHSYFSCEWVDVSTGVVTPAPPMNETRRYFRSLRLVDGNGSPVVVAIGGQQTDSITGTIEELGACSGGRTVISLRPPTVTLIGSAKATSTTIQLTSTTPFESGGMWLRERLPVAKGFDLRFSFRMNQGNDNGQPDSGPAGADGIAVVFQNEARTAIGQPGDGIGYNGVPHGLAIEFDSYLNAAFSDPSPSHVGVQVGDNMVIRPWHAAPYLRAVTSERVPLFVADGTIYFARVTLAGKRLFVYCSTTQDLGEPLLVVDSIDINEILRLRADGACYVGFTSSTGKSSQIHEFLSLEIEGCSPLVSSTEDEAEGSGSSFVDIGPTISPIPASSIANLRLQAPASFNIAAMIVDISGQVVASFEIPAGTTEVGLSVAGYPSGNYQVILRNGLRSLSVPLVISR